MGKQLRDALKASGVAAALKASPSRNEARPLGSPLHRAGSNETGSRLPLNLQESLQPEPKIAPRSQQPSRTEQVAAQGPLSREKGAQCSGTWPSPEVAVLTPKPVSRLIRSGSFHPHPLFMGDAEDDCELPEFGFLGAERQLTEEPDNETDMVIGLDFGTSSTKVVIRDLFAAMGTFPVPLNGDRPGIEGYLLPSRVFRSDGVYSLTEGHHRIGNLKLKLLESEARSPVDEFNDCCAFLALVIRRARAWLFFEHRDVYAGHQLNWRVNLGLAARSYEDEETVSLFRRLAWAAANVAADRAAEQISVEVVDRYRRQSLQALSEESDDVGDDRAFTMSAVDAVPEVSAQLHGLMVSARWDWSARPVMMLVDVGAGTVDCALFHVRIAESGKGALTFYSSRVERNGVMNLHRDRVAWLRELLSEGDRHEEARSYLAHIEKPTDRLRPIPGRVTEYLPGYSLEVVGEDVDDTFQRTRYRFQVAGSISDARREKGLKAHEVQGVPLLLCGGGARMEFYARIADVINSTPGWHVSVELTRLPVPQDLVDVGWYAEDFDRISVAYGLSISGDGGGTLERIVRAVDVPNRRAYQAVEPESRFVSKDQM